MNFNSPFIDFLLNPLGGIFILDSLTNILFFSNSTKYIKLVGEDFYENEIFITFICTSVFMDALDKKLIAALLTNSRQSFTQLAKSMRSSREVAFYRFQRLKERGILKSCYSLINHQVLGFQRHFAFIQLKDISPEKENEYFEFLVNHPFVTFFGSLIGKWNVGLDLLVKDEHHLKNVLAELITPINNHLGSFVVNGANVHEEVFHYKFFGLKDLPFHRRQSDVSLVNLDSVDRQILYYLSVDARADYSFLSKKLSLTANAIKHRIKRLESTGVILGYTASIDFMNLGYDSYDLQLKCSTLDNETLLNYLREHSQVYFFYSHLGQDEWNLDLGIFTTSSADLRSFLVELKSEFGSILKLQNIYLVDKILKDNVAPSGLFD